MFTDGEAIVPSDRKQHMTGFDEVAKMTIATRVLEELQRSSRTLDDDDLAQRLGLSHRQAVNQVCRKLEAAGRLRRYCGSGGKIVNEAVASPPGRLSARHGDGLPVWDAFSIREAVHQ